MDAEELRSLLCPDLVVEIDDADSTCALITSFTQPNGDSVTLFLEDRGDELVVSDEGDTLQFLQQQSFQLTTERLGMIRRMCSFHEVEFQEPRMLLRTDRDSLGRACAKLCEAATQVAGIYYHAPGVVSDK